MSYDAFTLSAIIVVAVLVVVVILLGRSKSAMEMKLRIMASNLTLMLDNAEAMELCRKIHEKYPQLCAGIDFTLKQEKGSNVKIDEWNSDQPRPD